jgi:hypothetical protein
MKGESFATNARVDSRLHVLCLGPWSERRNPAHDSIGGVWNAREPGRAPFEQTDQTTKRGRSTRPGIEVGQIRFDRVDPKGISSPWIYRNSVIVAENQA